MPDINFRMGAWFTALMIAVMKNNYEIAKLLLKQEKVDINLNQMKAKMRCTAIDNLNYKL